MLQISTSRLQSFAERSATKTQHELVRRSAVLLGLSLPVQAAGGEFAVQNIPLDQIHIDKARFQPRDDFSEEKVQEIVNNFNPALFKPLIVWRDPKNHNIYVLAGHHRYEALKRMKRKSAPAVFAEGNEQKAVELAWTENQSGRSQTSAENAKYLRKLAMSGRTQSEVQTECKRLYDRSCTIALDLSHLNPRGKALVDLGLLTRDSETFKDVETMAQWIGKLRGRFDDLTNSHENELYDFLRENYKIQGKRFTNYAAFAQFAEDVIEKRSSFGNIDERLNITIHVPKSAIAAEYDAQFKEAEKQLRQAETELSNQQAIVAKNTTIAPETAAKVIAKYNDAVILARRELLRLSEAKHNGVIEAKASEMALFGLGGERTSHQHYFAVKPEFWVTVGIISKPIWADCEALFRKRKRKDEEPEFSSPQELCEAIEYTLNNVEGVFTASKEDGIGLYAKQDGVFAVVMEIQEVRGRYRVATIWKAAYQKFAQKIKRNNRVIANAPSSDDLPASMSGVLSGRLGVPFDTHSIDSKGENSYSPAENQDLSGLDDELKKDMFGVSTRLPYWSVTVNAGSAAPATMLDGTPANTTFATCAVTTANVVVTCPVPTNGAGFWRVSADAGIVTLACCASVTLIAPMSTPSIRAVMPCTKPSPTSEAASCATCFWTNVADHGALLMKC